MKLAVLLSLCLLGLLVPYLEAAPPEMRGRGTEKATDKATEKGKGQENGKGKGVGGRSGEPGLGAGSQRHGRRGQRYRAERARHGQRCRGQGEGSGPDNAQGPVEAQAEVMTGEVAPGLGQGSGQGQ
ncbi:hypothetical protein BaRGS_00035994, partial [Batillaria attramentaria]